MDDFNRFDNNTENNTMPAQEPIRQTAPTQYAPEQKKPRKKRPFGMVAGILAGVIVVGSAAGYGGVYLAKTQLLNNAPSSSAAGLSTPANQPPNPHRPAESTPTLDELQENINSPQHILSDDIEFNSDGTYKYTRDLVREVQDTIVYIISTTEVNGQVTAKGGASGVVISKDGYIITNAHAVSGATLIEVKVNNAETDNEDTASEFRKAELIGIDSDTDLAVLKIDAEDLKAAKLGDSDKLSLGDDVVAIGNPYSLETTVTKGIISGLNREVSASGRGLHSIQTDTPINYGNSGGGLFNAYGEVVGIVNMKRVSTNAENISFAITINEAKSVINDLIETGYVTGRAWLGISYVPITESFFQSGALGWKVSKIIPGTELENSELVVGDTIIEIDGISVFDSKITNLFASKKPGDTVTLTVVRYDSFGRSKNVDIEAVLSEYKGN